MISPYRLVVFDWEGTIEDTLGRIIHSIRTEANRLNLSGFDELKARQTLNLGLMVAIKKLFPHTSLRQQEQLQHAVVSSSMSRSTDVFLLPGAKDIVQRLYEHRILLAIATNRGQQSLQRALHASGLESFFTLTRSASQMPAKPSPQMLENIMEICGVCASETLMIGDSVSDVEMAQAAQVDAFGVNFYHQSEPCTKNLLKAGALKVFNDYEQLTIHMQLT